ncbi:MAG: 4-demethylwyosine synthase TYW1 [Candidatus Aenigmatarchaeota archaeon]
MMNDKINSFASAKRSFRFQGAFSSKKKLLKLMEKQGYRFIGRHKHAAIKVCEWCRRSLAERGYCYKQKFYGISSHRCVQFAPCVFSCTHNCEFCWRTTSFSMPKNVVWDKPKELVDEAISAQKLILHGFGGNARTKKEKLQEALKPNQFAISLSGEPTLYPYLPELIDEIKSRGMTCFVVSNGTNPDMIKRLASSEAFQPTKMYITLPAPNENVYKKICHPMLKDGWKRLQKSLSLLKLFDSSVIRLTLVKKLNMIEPEKYAEIIKKTKPDFVECKAFMSIGGARERLSIETMLTFKEIKAFAAKLVKATGYKIADEKEDSRVVILKKA